MLTLQFVQPSEFENPYYQIFYDNNDPICTFQFNAEYCYWYIVVNDKWLLTYEVINEILAFHKEVMDKLEPKILGVF